MRSLTYDVAASLDGFIAGPGGDVSAFPHEGAHVVAYQERLGSYQTVIMGRATYEFGYAFGLQPGARAYPRMDHHIVSAGIDLPSGSDVSVIRGDIPGAVRRLKSKPGGDIYLCGGGRLAGLLLDAGLIDRVLIKRAPVILGSGTPLFSDADAHDLTPLGVEAYESGVVLERYATRA
ncbi:dihydrofolate reductase family protein [Roseobacter sp. HKCCA0434]|uniref:dihydrofolate reductase family protein n=1 Tax=Roseobacter sp. HKCCA0434 TaxID=3079297 RepID=UPI002905E964|nr:dihydrofolate reductase family protein [Roseobacter sp. HKCCA0434]